MKTTLITVLIMLSTLALGGQRYPDQISYKNHTFDVELENYLSVLEIYFEQNGIKPPPIDDSFGNTGRGYLAKWEVRTNSLYLVGMTDPWDLFSTSYDMGESLHLSTPTNEVKATWFTGTVRLDDNEGHTLYLSFDKGEQVDESDVLVSGSLDGVCKTKEQKKALVDFAKKTFNDPIESIRLTTHWYHPLDATVAVVRFKRKHLGGVYYEYSHALVNNKDCPPRMYNKEDDSWGPGSNDVVFGSWFTDKKIERSCAVKYTLRGCDVYLPPPDQRVSYNDIKRLLLSIEARDYAIAEPTRTVNEDGSVSMSISVVDTPPNIDAIGSIEIEEKDEKLIYTVWTSKGSLSGNSYSFETCDEGFVLISSGMWIS